MAPRLSVILPTHNRPDSLIKALRSISRQSVEDLEVLVVNDGGVPVRSVVEHCPTLDVTLIDLPERPGVSAARNRALERATGDYVAFLDDDDLYLPGHLTNALDALRRTGADAVYATASVCDTWVDPLAAEVPEHRHAFDFTFDDGFLSVLNAIPPTGLVLRNSNAIRFDAALTAAEDWDLWLRLVRHHGYRFAHLPSVGVVYHRVPAHASSSDPVGNGRRALGHFHSAYRFMLDRWKVDPAGPAAAYRGLVLRTYELAFERYDDNRTLGSFWYERLVRLLFDGFTAGRPAQELEPELSGLLDTPVLEPA